MVKKLTINVLEPFLSKPKEELHLADISRELSQPHPTVRLQLNLLEEKGILKKKLKGRLTLYYLNLDNSLLFDYLVISEKEKLLKKCEKNILLKELINFLHKKIFNSDIIIFGSAAKIFNKANDIDILAIGKTNKKDIENFSKKYNLPIHLINVQTIEDVTIALKEEIIKKHIIINNSEKIVRWLYW